MAIETKCPHCGKPVPATALQGICPECMLKVGLAETGEVGPDGTVLKKSAPAPRIEELAPHFPELEIIECLGRGGMGAVYKARQPKLDRFVALKILSRKRDDGRPDTEFAQRFEREARALARLSHPDIVAVYDFGEAGGFHFLLMEYVDGLTLRQLLQARKLKPEEALTIVPKICEVLQFAHERGIVHRDIKPENILLDKQGRLKIADFGIAKLVGQPGGASLTQERQIIGTPHYMAPEQVEKPASVDHRADIFSLGVVFYEMLTGELPLGKFAPPSKKVQVDVRLDEVVLHALEKEAERRYQHAREVKTDVETIAATPNRSTPAEQCLPVPSPRTHFAKLAIAMFLAGTLGTLVLMVLSPRHDMALVFGGVALVLAFIFGLMSWHERMGKFVVIALGSILMLLGLSVLIWTLAFVPARQRVAERARQAALEQLEQANMAAVRKQSGTPSTPPVVTKTVPESGATNVDSGLAELHVTFSEPMRDGGWSWVKVNDATFPTMTGNPRFLPDSQTCVLPVKLEPGKVYAVWVNSVSATNFQNAQGQAALPYLLIFETRK